MAEDDDDLIPDSGAVFTFGRSRFADNYANKFWIKNDPVLSVACGDEHSAVLTERGRVYVFGSNDWGQLGLGHVKLVTKPSFVKALKPEKIILISCGRSHTVVYSESRKLFSFGANEDGQLGHGDKTNEHMPKEISSLSGVTLKRISCGAYHSVALTEEGEVYVWGVNSDGQLGLGETDESSVPTKLKLEHDVRSLCCGYYHTAFIATNGILFTFGEDENGKLGLTESQCDDTTHPQPVAKLDGDKYLHVACGARHTVAITEKGHCHSWGDGSNGQLGHGTKLLEVALPTQIDSLNNLKIIYLSCGDGHTAVVSDSGKIFSFGDGRHGKLGQGDECFSNLFVPTIVSRFNGFHVNFVDCGGCHMLVGAIRKIGENIDEIDGEIVAEQVDMLNSSMRSNQSIAEANMTLKPGSMTYPVVTPRDKRRHKEDDVLNNSLNASLNASLNSSLNMAQLNRTMPPLPTVMDRSRLPKIHGVSQLNFNNYDKKDLRSIKENSLSDVNLRKLKDSDVEMKKNSRLVAAISFSRDDNKVDNKKSEESTSNKKVNKSKESDGSDNDESDRVKNKENKKSDKSAKLINHNENIADDSDDNNDGASGLKRKPIKKSQKIEIEKEEDDEDSDEDIDKMKKKKDKKKLGDKGLGKIEAERSEDDDHFSKGKKQGKKNKKLDDIETTPTRVLPSSGKRRKNKKEESEEDEEENENDDEEDEDEEESEEETIKTKSEKSALKSKNAKTEVKKNKEKGTPVKENKMKRTPEKKSKKVEESEDEEEDDDEEDDISEIEDIAQDEVEVDSEEEEEDSPLVKKKGKKEVSKEGSSKETPKRKIVNKKEEKGSKKFKGKEITKMEKTTDKKSLQNKSPEKKNTKPSKKELEEEEEEDDDDDEEEEEEDEEDEEEENDDEDDDDDEEDRNVDNIKKTDNTKVKKVKKKAEIDDSSKETNAEEPIEEANNRSGFLNFFRRSKKPPGAVTPPDSKSPERTLSPGSPTNKNQSKTCTIL